MDYQDLKKNQTFGGHESHGVHLCHKCGWPFPNPHPSARHRRAHRKICGTIDGYKFVDSQATVSDDEHASDDDLKTPGPNLLERSQNERVSGGTSARSNRSEDEVFADAVAEFPDSGSNLVNVEFAEKVKQLGRLTTIDSFKDAESTEFSAESNLVQNMVGSESILSADKWESPDHVTVNATSGLDKIASAEKQIKGSAHDPKEVSSCNISPAKSETETETETGAAKLSINSSDVCNLREVDAKEDADINSGRIVMDAAVSSSDHPSTELSTVVIVHSEAAISSSDQEFTNAGFRCNEVQNTVDYKMPSNDAFPDVATVEVTDDTSHTAENREYAFPGMHSTASGNPGQVYYGKGEDKNNVSSISDDIHTVDDSEITTKGFKDREDGKLPCYVSNNSLEIIDCAKETYANDNSSTSQSELCDEAAAVSVSESHGSEKYLENKSFRSNDEAIPTGFFLSDRHGTEGYLDQKGINRNPIELFISEGETVSENKLEETGSNANAIAVAMEERDIAKLPEESVTHACDEDCSLITSISKNTKVLPKVNSVCSPTDAAIGQAINVVCLDSIGKIDEATEKTDRADHDDNRRITVDQEVENIIANSGSVSIGSENEVNARVDVHSDNQVEDSEDGQSDNASVEKTAETDSGSNVLEGNRAGQEIKSHESAGDNQNLKIFFENAIDLPEKLAESEYTHAISVSGPQLNEIEGGGNKNIHLECVGVNKGAGGENFKDVMTDCGEVFADPVLLQLKITENECTLSDRILNTKEGLKELLVDDTDKVNAVSVEASIKSESDIKEKLPGNSMEDEDHKVEEFRAFPLDMATSAQSSGIIVQSRDVEFAKASSADKPQSFPDENDFPQQHTASVTDFSVGSSSQNSVEGHWGSVSVLSTISDIPAIVDTESIPSNGLQVSSDREKMSSNKQKAEVEAPHLEKADIFEPPSFMTLVEPKSAKPSVSEIQNPQRSTGSLQAGWFPSLSHVVNESQGRKKNEEIIAKVTNWSTEKQNTPLKNLLGEAKVEGQPKSPNVKENQPQVETTQTGMSVTTVSSILGAQDSVTDPGKNETGRDWNSPARYPADIKRERRKVKGRPYWAHFVCCSSVN